MSWDAWSRLRICYSPTHHGRSIVQAFGSTEASSGGGCEGSEMTNSTRSLNPNDVSGGPAGGAPVLAGHEQMHFLISWNEDEDAALIRLVDNDQPISLAGAGEAGRGSIAVTYQTRAAVQHVIEWRLTFPGKTLTELAARAHRQGQEASELKTADKAENVWADRGTL
jgi:hypothetical protein